MIRRFNLVAEPSKKWGNRPLATDINQGDDMERMRNNRNDLVHRPKGGLSEEEREKFEGSATKLKRRIILYKSDMSNFLYLSVSSVCINIFSALLRDFINLLFGSFCIIIKTIFLLYHVRQLLYNHYLEFRSSSFFQNGWTCPTYHKC
jgi:hypothetical protein